MVNMNIVKHVYNEYNLHNLRITAVSSTFHSYQGSHKMSVICVYNKLGL